MSALPVTFSMPWPPAVLSPNARRHRLAVVKIRKRYRADCAWSAIAAGLRRMEAPVLTVRLVFHPPDHRPRDIDNMLASIKAGLDGVADVVGVDDSRWALAIARGAPEPAGRVEVTLEPGASR